MIQPGLFVAAVGALESIRHATFGGAKESVQKSELCPFPMSYSSRPARTRRTIIKKTSASCDVEIDWQTTYNHSSLNHKNNLQSDVYRGIYSSSQCLMIPYGSDGERYIHK